MAPKNNPSRKTQNPSFPTVGGVSKKTGRSEKMSGTFKNIICLNLVLKNNEARILPEF